MATIDEVIPSLGNVPTTADPASFDARADTLLGTALPAFRDSVNVWSGQANTLGAYVTGKSSEATTAASDAEAAAVAAAAASGAEKWVSGATYAEGDGVWSPINFQSYRNKTGVNTTTDPSLDNANWEPIGAPSGWESTILTSATTLVAGRKYLADASGGAFPVAIPATLTVGARFVVGAYGGDVTIDGTANSKSLYRADGVTQIHGDQLVLQSGDTAQLVAISSTGVKIV